MRRFIVVVSFVLMAASAFAQQAPPKMTWVRTYTVEYGREADFLRLIREETKPIFDALLKENKIAGWGVAVPVTHSSDPTTHLVYAALPDWGGADDVANAIEKANAAMTPADMKRMGELASSIRQGSMRDIILRHVVQTTTAPASQPRYIRTDTHVIKTGREGDAVQLFNEWAKPIFVDLAAKGTVSVWGLSVHGVPDGGQDGWTHMVWYFMPDMAGQDVIDTINEGSARTKGYWLRLWDMSVPEKYRGTVYRIITP